MWKMNQVKKKECKEAMETICACQRLLYKIKVRVQEHIDFADAKTDAEFYEKYGKWSPSNAEIVRTTMVLRDELLEVKKLFDGVK